MATRQTRPQRAQRAAPTSYDDPDSGNETEPETPKPTKSTGGIRRRISEVHDKSYEDGPRLPAKTVNINDDAAEKRRRRKSARVVIENAEAGPSGTTGSGDAPGATAGNAPRPTTGARKSAAVPPLEIPAINVPRDVMSSNYEEWMKMAMDNKINAANSWNFALIDYFHDMSLLKNQSDDTINFQRASSTLDGCVKIWTSRVDSVGTETGKLLSNLANEGRAEEDDEEGSDNPDTQDPSQPRKKTKHKSEATLAKNIAQLKSKKLDLEFSVDPLFRKTCADFDEGGANGLLMNHLSLGVGKEAALRIIFDASDSMGKGEGDGEAEAGDEPFEAIDLSELRLKYLPDLSILDSKAICHSLDDFAFARDPTSFDDSIVFREGSQAPVDDDDDFSAPQDDFNASMDIDGPTGPPPPEEDFFAGHDPMDSFEDGGMSHDGMDDSGTPGFEQGQYSGGPGIETMGAGMAGSYGPYDPRHIRNESDRIIAQTEGDGQGGMIELFDQRTTGNWAGPEHWKLKKTIKRPEATADATNKTKRERKETNKIDFLTPAEKDYKETAKTLFAPVTRGAGITLPKSATLTKTKRGRKSGKEKEKREDYTLPFDMHFNSKNLDNLFLKPDFRVSMRRRNGRTNQSGEAEVDENFWAQNANQAAQGNDSMDEPNPFDTQIFGDFDDGGGFDDDGPDMGPSTMDLPEQDLLAGTQGQSRRVRPEKVNYAKKAKRIDVKQLKDNIWKNLNIVCPEKKEEEGEDVSMDTDEGTDPNEARAFDAVITGLKSSYPPEKLSDISTSFCFICLLHLCNERGLKLKGGVDEDEVPWDEPMAEDEELEKVGNIWDVKVFRDPTAIPSA